MRYRASGTDSQFVGSHAIAQGLLTRHQLRSGAYRRVLHGIYAVPPAVVDHALAARAATLVIPKGAAVGGASAAYWHGGPLPEVTAPVTVVLPEGVDWKGPKGIRVHRTRLGAGELIEIDGIPCTTAIRTAWDVCALDSLRTGVAAVDAMLHAGTLSPEALERMLGDGVGKWGAARVRRAIGLVDGRAESPPESWLRVAFVLAGLPPCIPQFEVVVGGVFLARGDLAWPEARLLVEYEGAYHFDGLQIVKDDARIARLVAAGWRVIRVSAADLRDLDAVIAQVRAALRDAGVLL